VRHRAAARRDVRGQAAAWLAIMLPLFLAVVGLAVDGVVVLGARRELQDIADGAARAGATAVDEQRYREQGTVELVEGTARQRAEQALARVESRRLDGRPAGEVLASRTEVAVSVRGRARLAFIRIVGVRTAEVRASARARPFPGITRAE
jgi:uncharacterized membrane protein